MSQESPSLEDEHGDAMGDQGQDSTSRSGTATRLNRGTIGSLPGILVGLIAAGLTWTLLWHFEPAKPSQQPFSVPEAILAEASKYVMPPPEIQLAIQQGEEKVAILTSGFFLGFFGLFLGLGLGLAHGIFRRSLGSAILATLVAGMLGGLFGVASGVAGHFAFSKLPNLTEFQPLAISILAHGATLGILGGGVGLGFGLGTRQGLNTLNCLIFGLLGGVMASCVYAFSASLIIPDTATHVLLPERLGYGRLLWSGVTGVLIGGLIPNAAVKSAGKNAADTNTD